jgi:hypothetical protein
MGSGRGPCAIAANFAGLVSFSALISSVRTHLRSSAQPDGSDTDAWTPPCQLQRPLQDPNRTTANPPPWAPRDSGQTPPPHRGLDSSYKLLGRRRPRLRLPFSAAALTASTAPPHAARADIAATAESTPRGQTSVLRGVWSFGRVRWLTLRMCWIG